MSKENPMIAMKQISHCCGVSGKGAICVFSSVMKPSFV